MGATGLFVALALAMYLTRNVDWYALGGKPTNALAPTANT
jgi:inner membrane protein involved in colicin E2 resistance